MVTCASNIVGNKVPHEFYGLSTDVKPTYIEGVCNVTNGSIFLEIDTKKIFVFDEEHQIWVEQ